MGGKVKLGNAKENQAALNKIGKSLRSRMRQAKNKLRAQGIKNPSEARIAKEASKIKPK